jgi:acetylornithine deacetylase/succinyl-diaminopimelate desuccinylase-like protein
VKEIYDWIDQHRDELIEELKCFLRIPSSVSAGDDLEICAEWVRDAILKLGAEVEISPTDGDSPIVFGKLNKADNDKSVICYGHYDVQPVEPINEWTSDPYGAHTIDGKIIARGAIDDKSGVMASIHATRAFMAVRNKLPVNIKFVIEGEEEVGSVNLGNWVEKHRHELKADAEYTLDGTINKGSGRVPLKPCWPFSIMEVEFRCKTTKTDFHCNDAQLAPNAAWRLVWALSSMKDHMEQIKIDGWYDNWLDASEKDWEFNRIAEFDIEAYKEKYGIDKLLLGRTDPAEIYYARHYLPTMNITGMQSGYVNEGYSTRVPSYAFAKVDFRPKGFMDPAELFPLIRRHLDENGFSDIECIMGPHCYSPDFTPADSPIVQAMADASREVFGTEPDVIALWRDAPYNPEGSYKQLGPGSLKNTGTNAFAALGIPFCIGAFGDEDSVLHAPNEYITIDSYIRGIKYAATILERFAEKQGNVVQ